MCDRQNNINTLKLIFFLTVCDRQIKSLASLCLSRKESTFTASDTITVLTSTVSLTSSEDQSHILEMSFKNAGEFRAYFILNSVGGILWITLDNISGSQSLFVDGKLFVDGVADKLPMHLVLGILHQGDNTNLRLEISGQDLSMEYEGIARIFTDI